MTRMKLAELLAKKSGKRMRKVFSDPKKNGVTRKPGSEIVTDLDKEINTFVIEQVHKHFADDDLVTEEAEAEDRPGTFRWFVDPIDGTDDFVWGIPLFCISIGCADEQGMLFGIVYDPVHDELFTAERGKGAFANGKKISVSKRQPPELLLRFAGRGYSEEAQTEDRNLCDALDPLFKKQRYLGTAALMLCYVAAGRGELLTLTGTTPWDSAAGSLIVTEAGGRVTNFAGTPWAPDDHTIMASNGLFHEDLVKRISDR